jgi:hypothetical protein
LDHQIITFGEAPENTLDLTYVDPDSVSGDFETGNPGDPVGIKFGTGTGLADATKLANLSTQFQVIGTVQYITNLVASLIKADNLQIGGGGSNGTCDTTISGYAVHRLSGDPFTGAMNDQPININGVAYTVAHTGYIDGDHLTLTTSPGNQSNKKWSYGRSPQIRIFDRSNALMGFWGDDSADSGFVGAWIGRNLWIGGTSITDPAITVDVDGNVAFNCHKGGTITLGKTQSGVTMTLTIGPNNAWGEPILIQGTDSYASFLGLYAVYFQNALNQTAELSSTQLRLNDPVSGQDTILKATGITRYQGADTSGIGVPAIYDSPDLGAQTASIGPYNLRVGANAGSPAPTGLYRVFGAMWTSVAGTGGTATWTLTWTDRSGIARSMSAAINLNTTAYVSGGLVLLGFPPGISPDGATDIQWSVTVAGATKNPKYDIQFTMERLEGS